MAQAPPNLLAMFNEFKKRAPKSWNVRLGGIVGDAAHGYGYHLAPNQLSGSDYSMQKSEDVGSGINRNYASALDITMSETGMRAVTASLIKAAESPTDNRVGWAREFYGTTNGYSVNGRIHSKSGEGWGFASSDSSHLWHVHLGIFRKYNNDKAKLADLMNVMLGVKEGGQTPEGDNEMQLNDKVTLFKRDDVKYSSQEVSVETILASTNYYVLQLRNMVQDLAKEVDALKKAQGS